jgi:SAM-dependent methyltransferase
VAVEGPALQRPLTASIYDYPQYFEATFREETRPEADFIEAACRTYGLRCSRRMLELGCGGGRLVVELARRGYDLTAIDLSEPALAYLRRRLQRSGRAVDVLHADMAGFRLRRPVDAAFCTFNTFRHLLTEQDALAHLRCVVSSLRPGGIYILGLHLLPPDIDENCIERWTGRQGNASVCVTLRVLAADRRQRLEQIRLSMLVRHGQRSARWRTEFSLRMYTAAQFRRLLGQVPQFEICDVFDFWYDIEQPLRLDNEITDTVVVLRKTSSGSAGR